MTIRKWIASLLFLLFSHLAIFKVGAQIDTAETIDMEMIQSSFNAQILRHIVKISNRSIQPFKGSLVVDAPTGMRTLSQTERLISVDAGDSCFVSFKLVVGKESGAGRLTICYTLRNNLQVKVTERKVMHEIEKREQIYLITDEIPKIHINQEDSVRIQVSVNNAGNTTEEVTLVFNIPNLRGAAPFHEVKTTLSPMQRKEIPFQFFPSENLLSTDQFLIQVTAMKGKEKTIFGSKTITVQNVITHRSYVSDNGAYSQLSGFESNDNAVTLSYRHFNSGSNMLQLQGGGYLNLPAGYLQVKGNIYQYSSQKTPLVTNTSVKYKLHENEFTLGNVSEYAEMPLYGRGAKVTFVNPNKSKSITFGAIDHNYNLIAPDPWFSGYNSFYVQGTLDSIGPCKGVKGSYIYQKNPYERATFHVGSVQWGTVIGKSWNFNLKLHGAMSRYDQMKGNQFTGAAEFKYNGRLFSDIMLSGSGYYSDAYFPGNRKGTLSLTQGISKYLTDEMYLSLHISYNRTEPKSYAYTYTYQSENNYGNVTLSLPKIRTISSALFYQYQGEASSPGTYDQGNGSVAEDPAIRSHRLGWNWRWQSHGRIHSLFGTLEGGLLVNPFGEDILPQAKVSLNYSVKWFAAHASLQKGAYYLYEAMIARQMDEEFRRFSASASVNHSFSKKWMLTSGLNYTHDVYQGSIPSINLTTSWLAKKNLSLSLNAYWYQYNMTKQNNVFNVQLGVTYHFKKRQLTSGKKSAIIAKVYYDYNANNHRDEGDASAEGYMLHLDGKAFTTDKKGEMRYLSVPFGDYAIKPLLVGEWFFEQKDFKVEGLRTQIEIPLRQNGTLRGSILYCKGDNSLDITPRYEGLRFIITCVDEKIRQTVVTGSDGQFLTFLPVGEYILFLDKKTLMEHTDCNQPQRKIRIEAGKITEPEPFDIEIKSRKVNVKKFIAE